MKTRNNPSFTWTLLGLLLLALVILSTILAGVDCHLAGGVLVRTAANSYACVTLQKNDRNSPKWPKTASNSICR